MREIIIGYDEDKKIVTLIQEGSLIEKYEIGDQKRRLEGNIYIGKVENVIQGLQAAFIDIGEEKNAFIHLKDILPKKDITKIEEKKQEGKIEEVIKKGMPILVEVKKDSTDKKGPRVSTHLSLTGRYLVYMPNTDIITISQKIEKEEEKNRLKYIVKENLPENRGVIIRTSCQDKEEKEIIEEIKTLERRWKYIDEEYRTEKEYPRLVEKNHNPIKRLIYDMIDKGLTSIYVEKQEDYQEIESYLKEISQKKVDLIIQDHILEKYDLKKQLERSKSRKIWLNCGGFITIDKTEALTAIDVNSGKYTGKREVEQTIFKVNREATKEIAKQIRLRDIGGIIVIDYIDMVEEKHKQELIELLEVFLKQDRSKTQVLGFTKLNLLEMTRKHICSEE